MVALIERRNIDDKKWNGCVHFARNDFPYGYTWYLDNVTAGWDGLVWGDYEMVMPLTWNRKYGFWYLYQPFFTQQLGIFSARKVSADVVGKFLMAIPQRFKYMEISLNYLNPILPAKGYIIKEKTNLILPLKNSYENMVAQYSLNLKRNLKKAKNSKLRIHTYVKPEKLVDFYSEHTGKKVREWKPKMKHVLHRIIYNALHYNMGLLCGVYDDTDGLIAAGFFLYSRKRIVNLLPASSEKGRQSHAMSLLLDYIIQTHANKEMTLDFEGSSIEGVARFYRSFGAQEQNYFLVKKNELPWYVQLFKRN